MFTCIYTVYYTVGWPIIRYDIQHFTDYPKFGYFGFIAVEIKLIVKKYIFVSDAGCNLRKKLK